MTPSLQKRNQADAGMLPCLSSPEPAPAAKFTEQQLKQLRAQCVVFLAFRNNMEPKERHLEIALGRCPEDWDRRWANGDGSHDETTSSSSLQPSSSAVLPPPDPSPLLSSLRLSSPGARPRRQPRRGLGKIQRS